MDEYISREDYCEENCGKENREGYKTCKNCGMLNIPAANVQPANQWISVKNNLPKEAVKVLIYTEYNAIAYGFFTGAYYNNRPLFAMTINRNSERSWYEEIRVSHWRPLPEPPKED